MQVAIEEQTTNEPPKALEERLLWFADKLDSVVEQATRTHATHAQFLLAMCLAEFGRRIAKTLREAEKQIQN